MAVKKSELYSSLWASCDSLRGGMDSSQYKDYILTLLFVKYVSDKFKGVAYGDIDVPEGGSFDDMLALIGSKNIGEKMDKIIAKLAEKNNLQGVINNAHFNDEDKLGKGKEMVDKLSELLCIFRDQMPDFSKNRADGDDIIGDAYEYLMRKFATESGKSKGQFYTPAEVSRILAKVVGIEHARGNEITLYDPACGSGSLLIRTAEAAPVDVSIYGQEKDVTTAGLARMAEDLQSIEGHLKGGIPGSDVESLSLYWETFPSLRAASFSPLREGFYSLAVEKDAIRDTINDDTDFSAYADKVENAYENWKATVDGKLRAIDGTTKPKLLIAEIADRILEVYEPVTLVDKYDAYEVLLSYWNEVMSDDVYLLVQDGYKAVRDIEVFTKTTTKKKRDG